MAPHAYGVCLTWHRLPVKPVAQLHVNALTASVHIPPFRHGCGSHSLMSVCPRKKKKDEKKKSSKKKINIKIHLSKKKKSNFSIATHKPTTGKIFCYLMMSRLKRSAGKVSSTNILLLNSQYTHSPASFQHNLYTFACISMNSEIPCKWQLISNLHSFPWACYSTGPSDGMENHTTVWQQACHGSSHYCLTWQRMPVKPALQVHVNELTPSVQTPSFWHGIGAQSLILVCTRKKSKKEGEIKKLTTRCSIQNKTQALFEFSTRMCSIQLTRLSNPY